MKKKFAYFIIFIIWCFMTFGFSTMGTCSTTLNCTVVEIDPAILPEGTNNNIVLQCDNINDIDNIKIGQKVKIKITKNKKPAIEGC